MRYYNKKAFSILELSISLLIISFIASMILVGNNLYNQSKLRAVIKEIQVLNNAVNIFKERYDYLPGDISNPPSSWNAVGGNGNNQVELSSETGNVFHHLYMAGFINQVFVSYLTGSNFNLYKSSYMPSLYSLRNSPVFYYGNVLAFEFGLINAGATYAASYSSLKPIDAYYIDSKLDDGIANFGVLAGVDGDDATTGGCSGNYNNTLTTAIMYNTITKTAACRLFYFGNPNFNIN